MVSPMVALGAGSLALDAFSAFSASGAAKKQNKAARNMMLDNQQWSEHMRNTAYQTAMSDMKNAGLNPMLAYSQGGAPIPSTSAPPVVSEGLNLGNAAASARELRMQDAQLDNLQADTSKKTVEAYATKNQGIKAHQDTVNADQDYHIKILSQDLLKQQIHSAKNATRVSDADAAMADIDRKIYESQYGAVLRNLQKILNPASSAKALMR